MAEDNRKWIAVKFGVGSKSVTAIQREGDKKPETYCRDHEYAKKLVARRNKEMLLKRDR